MTQKEKFQKSTYTGSSPQPIPEFPRLPNAIRNRLTEGERKEVDEYEEKVQEFFKQQAQRGF